MNDIEKVELAARRTADKERRKCKEGGTTNIDIVEVFDTFADELHKMNAATRVAA